MPAMAWAAPDARDKSAVSMLPDGSELQNVTIPRYDEKRRLVGLMKAATLRLVDRTHAAADDVTILFHDEDQKPRGQIDLDSVLYQQNTGLIRSDEPVHLRSDRLNADGTGLRYDVRRGDGFLVGPALTWIPATKETAMTPKQRPLRTAALLGASAITLVSAETKQPSAGETAAAASRTTREELAKALADSEAAHQAASSFLKKTDGVDAANAEGAVPEAKPLDIQPGPNDTVISCDGGMYFEPEQGVFVYLKNVKVKDPRFSLSGANELKIFLGKKTGAKEGHAGDKNKMNLGEVERVTASGTLVFEQKPEGGGEPIRASGAFFSYQVKTDQVILSGGYPWVVQGGIALRAREPNLTLRIQPKSRRFQTEGQWDTILPLEQLQNKDR